MLTGLDLRFFCIPEQYSLFCHLLAPEMGREGLPGAVSFLLSVRCHFESVT